MERTSVLLIDDDPDMATITGRVVEKAGFRFYWARTAKEGLAEMLKQAPNVVLLDHMLPDMNGLEFLRKLRNDPKYAAIRETPVMMLTAYEPKPNVTDQMFALNLAAYLRKPFGHRELVNIIWNVCELHRVRTSTSGEGNGADRIARLKRVIHILRGLQQDESEHASGANVDQLLAEAKKLIEQLQAKRGAAAARKSNRKVRTAE